MDAKSVVNNLRKGRQAPPRKQGAQRETTMVFVHEIVAQTFIPNPDKLPFVEHIDGNRTNNRADNLRWTAIKPEGYPNDGIKF